MHGMAHIPYQDLLLSRSDDAACNLIYSVGVAGGTLAATRWRKRAIRMPKPSHTKPVILAVPRRLSQMYRHTRNPAIGRARQLQQRFLPFARSCIMVAPFTPMKGRSGPKLSKLAP